MEKQEPENLEEALDNLENVIREELSPYLKWLDTQFDKHPIVFYTVYILGILYVVLLFLYSAKNDSNYNPLSGVVLGLIILFWGLIK
jgi:hypothetical protein